PVAPADQHRFDQALARRRQGAVEGHGILGADYRDPGRRHAGAGGDHAFEMRMMVDDQLAEGFVIELDPVRGREDLELAAGDESAGVVAKLDFHDDQVGLALVDHLDPGLDHGAREHAPVVCEGLRPQRRAGPRQARADQLGYEGADPQGRSAGAGERVAVGVDSGLAIRDVQGIDVARGLGEQVERTLRADPAGNGAIAGRDLLEQAVAAATGWRELALRHWAFSRGGWAGT